MMPKLCSGDFNVSYWVWLGFIVYSVVYLTTCVARGVFAGLCSYIYCLLGGSFHSRLYIGSYKMAEENLPLRNSREIWSTVSWKLMVRVFFILRITKDCWLSLERVNALVHVAMITRPHMKCVTAVIWR